jgi:hypothetical protein
VAAVSCSSWMAVRRLRDGEGCWLSWASREVKRQHVEAGAAAPGAWSPVASWWLAWGAWIWPSRRVWCFAGVEVPRREWAVERLGGRWRSCGWADAVPLELGSELEHREKS